MKFRNSFIVLFFVSLLVVCKASFADLVLNDGHSSLKNDLYWYKSDLPVSIDTISQLPLSEFNEPLGRDFSDGYDLSHYWFRITLDFESSQVSDWLLEIPFALLDKVSFYKQADNGQFIETYMGDRFVFSERLIPIKNFLLPVKNKQNKQTLYVHVHTQDSVQVPMSIWPEHEFMPHYAMSIGVQMAFFGAMLVMIFYNIFIYVSTRDRNYLFYIAFIGTMVLFQLGLQGFSHQWLWPNNPWWSNVSIPLFGVLSLTCGLLFVRYLLSTRHTLPKYDVILRSVSYCMILTVPAIMFGNYDFAIDVSIVVTSIFFNLTLFAIITLALKGDKTAKIVLVAWSVFLISGSVSMLGIMGLLPLEYAGTHALQFGSMVEVILLSLALADRIKTLRKEKLAMEVMSNDILKISNEQLEKSNKLKDAFIATISHEIKTPMNAILGSAQLLRDEKLNVQQEEYVSTIDRSGEMLVSILDSVLEYSKLEAGKVVVNEREVETAAMFEDVISLFAVQLNAKAVRIWLSLDSNVPEKVYMDDSLYKHVIMNLLSNAIKFTEQGFIFVHVKMDEQGCLVLEVQDTGIGMNPQQAGNIFKAFSQADDSTSRTYGGTGLGLAICKRICSLMEGDISVESHVGKGSCFTARISIIEVLPAIKSLPINVSIGLNNALEQALVETRFMLNGTNTSTGSTDSMALCEDNDGHLNMIHHDYQVSVGKIITTSSLNSNVKELNALIKQHQNKPDTHNPSEQALNVLAVDDVSTNRMIIKKVLERLKVNHKVVESGETGISEFLKDDFDLILMDIEMPEMDGYQTTKMIRKIEQDKKLKATPIVALSAHTAPEFREKAISSGMDDFFSKPIQIPKLRAYLDELQANRKQLTTI